MVRSGVTEVRSAEWLDKLGRGCPLKLRYTVARMLSATTSRSASEGTAIAVHEFCIRCCRGTTVALKTDVELGAIDQLFNLLVGGTDARVRPGAPGDHDRAHPRGLDGAEQDVQEPDNYVGIDEPAP
jgi:tyrosyl-tRNA synthetase